MNQERREKAIAWIKEEIRSLERAPELNGCHMTPEWAAQLDIMRTCLEAVQDHFPDTTKMIDHFRDSAKMVTEMWKPCDQCKSCESCYKLHSFHCYDCKEMSEFVPDSSFCGKCGRPRTLGAWAELEKRLRGGSNG